MKRPSRNKSVVSKIKRLGNIGFEKLSPRQRKRAEYLSCRIGLLRRLPFKIVYESVIMQPDVKFRLVSELPRKINIIQSNDLTFMIPLKEKTYIGIKEMAVALDRSINYVEDMRRGGFTLPATLAGALDFIRLHGPPGKFRSQPLPRK